MCVEVYISDRTQNGWRDLLAQLETGSALDGVQQLFAQHFGGWECGQLQQIHARTGRRQTIRVAGILDAKRRIQILCNDKRHPFTNHSQNHETSQIYPP